MKVSVKVILEINEDGIIKPLTVYYEGKQYDIDRVIAVYEYYGDKQGMFEIRIKNNIRFLYHEFHKWYVRQERVLKIN